MQRIAARIPVNDADLVRHAIVHGLKDEIRRFVLMSRCTSIEEVMEAARLAEDTADDVPTTADRAMMKQLATQVSAIQEAVNKLSSPPRLHVYKHWRAVAATRSQLKCTASQCTQCKFISSTEKGLTLALVNTRRTIYRRTRHLCFQSVLYVVHETGSCNRDSEGGHSVRHTVAESQTAHCTLHFGLSKLTCSKRPV